MYAVSCLYSFLWIESITILQVHIYYLAPKFASFAPRPRQVRRPADNYAIAIISVTDLLLKLHKGF